MDQGIGKDRLGQPVKIGDGVRLFSIRPSILKRLTGDELADVSSMLGRTFPVFDVYENGLVWVGLSLPRDDGSTGVHAIAVDAEAIELADAPD